MKTLKWPWEAPRAAEAVTAGPSTSITKNINR